NSASIACATSVVCNGLRMYKHLPRNSRIDRGDARKCDKECFPDHPSNMEIVKPVAEHLLAPRPGPFGTAIFRASAHWRKTDKRASETKPAFIVLLVMRIMLGIRSMVGEMKNAKC